MSDNTILNAGSGGDTIAFDDISGVKHQRIKLIHGADGVNAGDVATANPLPIGLDNQALTAVNHAITAKLATDSIQDGLTALTPKFANFDAAAGDIVLVAAVAGKRIRLLCACIACDVTGGTIRFEDGAGGSALSGLMEVILDDHFILPFNPVGWLQTSTNTALNLEAVTTGAAGMLTYVEV